MTGSISGPTLTKIGTHAAPQPRPIAAARQNRISHFSM
jgi:hypothetical protein